MPTRSNQPSSEEMAALKKELRIITATAEKQLSEMQRVVGFLRDSNDYHLFEKQLRRQAETYGWPQHILDPAVPDISAADYDLLDKEDPEELATRLLYILETPT